MSNISIFAPSTWTPYFICYRIHILTSLFLLFYFWAYAVENNPLTQSTKIMTRQRVFRTRTHGAYDLTISKAKYPRKLEMTRTYSTFFKKFHKRKCQILTLLSNVAVVTCLCVIWRLFMVRFDTLFITASRAALARGEYHHARIAVTIQGKAEQLVMWQNVLANMSTKSEIDFFCLLYDSTVDSTTINAWYQWLVAPHSPLKGLIYNSTTTWTTGRNMLAQAIYAEEVKRAKQYTYWMFLDGDAWLTNCEKCPSGTIGAACCWDYLFGDVLSSDYSFATVSTLANEIEALTRLSETGSLNKTFVFKDCADAQGQAFHRDAVPVILPYHADLDVVSWWSSQAILFRYTSGCLPGSNVGLGRHFLPQMGMHADYPRGRGHAGEITEESVVTTLFPSISDILTRPGICTDQYMGEIRTIYSKSQLNDWRRSDTFRRCLDAKNEYFIREVGLGIRPPPK